MKLQLKRMAFFGISLMFFSSIGFAEVMYVPNGMELELRVRPSKESKILSFVRSGQKLEILEPGDDWSRVRTANGKEGYLVTKYLITEERWRQIKEAERKKQEEIAEEKKRKTEAERKKQEDKRRKVLAAQEEKQRKDLKAREENRRKVLEVRKAKEDQEKATANKRLDNFEKKYGVTDWPVMKDFSVNPFIYKGEKVAFVSEFGTMLSATEGVFQCSGELFIVSDIPKGFFTKEVEVVIAGRLLGKKETKLPLLGEVLVPNLKFVGAYFCEKQHCRDIVWK